eukprot:5522468-Pleurochrysis_carterae.AAC.6
MEHYNIKPSPCRSRSVNRLMWLLPENMQFDEAQVRRRHCYMYCSGHTSADWICYCSSRVRVAVTISIGTHITRLTAPGAARRGAARRYPACMPCVAAMASVAPLRAVAGHGGARLDASTLAASFCPRRLLRLASLESP